MSINFKNIPATLRVPLFYAEIDPSQANPGQISQRALLIGNKIAAGTAVANIPFPMQSVDDVKAQCGNGSILAQMADTYRKNDNFGEVWVLPVDDAGAGAAATGSINTTAAATAQGVLHTYIGGLYVPLLLTGVQTAAQIATALVAAISARPDLAVTAVVNGVTTSKVDLTAKNKGDIGNDIDIRFNYLGTAGGQSFPAGYAATIVPMAGGATNPTLTTALANLTDQAFDFIAIAWNDTITLDAMKNFLNDVSGRWSWSAQVYGHCMAAYRGTYAQRITFGGLRNDQHVSVMGFYDSPTPCWKWAAAIAGQVAISVRADPGIPIQGVPIYDVQAPPVASRDPIANRNALLYDGIATFRVDLAGQVQIENLITTYQTNAFGQPDQSYLESETLFLLTYVLRRMAAVVNTKYSRKKLAADGTRFDPGANVVTPNIIKSDLVALYRELEAAGVTQKSAQFEQALIVEINGTNPSRIDVLWPGVLIQQLRIFALLAQFRLS
jgi:phage tail sheath gpL-like